MGLTSRMTASVVVATRDRPVTLGDTLDALAAQTAIPGAFEVILVDNGTQADLGRLVREARARHPQLCIRWVREARPGPGVARNRGIIHARGAIVLFTDDDCVPEPGWVEAMVRAFDAGPAIVGVEGLTYTRVKEVSPFVHFTAGAGGGYPTCNAGYRAGPLRASGGFDWAAFPAANKEDVDLAYRMMRSGAVIFVPSARVFHPARPISFRYQVRRMPRLMTDELCMMGRWSRHIRQYAGHETPHAVRWPDGREEVVWSSPNPIRGRVLIARRDLLRRRPLLYGKILLMLALRSWYVLPFVPGAVLHAWKHRAAHDLAPLIPPNHAE